MAPAEVVRVISHQRPQKAKDVSVPSYVRRFPGTAPKDGCPKPKSRGAEFEQRTAVGKQRLKKGQQPAPRPRTQS